MKSLVFFLALFVAGSPVTALSLQPMAHYEDNPIPDTLVWEILGLARPSLEQQLNQDLPQSLLLEKYNDHELTIDYLGRDPDDPSKGIYRVKLEGGLSDIAISDGI